MKKALLLACAALALTTFVNAQAWQWGRRGGSSDNGSGSGDRETITDMATDGKGNLYILALVGKTALNFDGNSKTGYGAKDLMVISVSCNGSYRWSKVIGGFNTDVGRAIKTDALGGVYVLAQVSSSNSFGYANFDTDTALGQTNKTLMLVKYDTSGNYKWLRQPEADTVTPTGSANFPLDLAVDANGTCHAYCILSPGSFAKGGYVNTGSGPRILRYDAQGNFLGNTTPQITGGDNSSYANLKMVHSPSGKYYFTGTSLYITAPALTINSATYNFPFVVALNSSGGFLWGKQASGGVYNIYSYPALDANGRVFITGAAANGASFNSFTATNMGFGGPVINAMDTNGTTLWNSYGTLANGSAGGLAVISKGSEVAITGSYAGALKWPGAADSLKLAASSLYNVFIARFNASTGAYIRQDSLSSPAGYSERPTSIVVDRNGNYFVGGWFEAQIKVAGATLISIGGETDIFVAKYGVSNCSCIAPVSGFNANINPTTKVGTFTYTGTTPIDSVRWNFGDGTTSNQMNPTHTFPSGNYNVCVTAYNSCGSNQYCNSVALAVAALTALGNVNVYPNSAANYFTVEGANGASAILTNSIGQRAMQFSINSEKKVADISMLPAGIYILQLTDAKGNRVAIRILKQ